MDSIKHIRFTMSDEGCWLLQLCTVVGALFIAKGILSLLCSLLTVVHVIIASYLWKRNLVSEYGGKWAVVTGSTDGIGKEYARQLAQKGMNIVLISRTLEKLKKVEEEIRKDFSVDTHIIQVDFLHGREIYEGIAEGLKDKDIGILVNNVGYFGLPQKFINVTEEEIWRFVNINVASVVAMTKVVLPQMLTRKRGAIINLSSITALCPLPYNATYAATKAFVSFFSQALEFEYNGSGITVQTVEPGFVSTNMTSYASTSHNPSMTVSTADACVSSTLNNLGYSKITAGTWSHAILTFILNQCNRQLAMYILEKYGISLEEEWKKTK